MPSRPCCYASHQSFSRLLRDHQQQQHHSKQPYLKGLVIAITVVGTGLLLVVLLVLFLLWFHRLTKSRDAGHPAQSDETFRKLHKFSYRELKRATNSFHDSQKLGKGGYGVVYRGLLRSGKEVAVKKLVLSSVQGEREFQNELSICRRLESRYVVKLLGFSSHGEKVRLLVYECMQNRSLQEVLLEKNTSLHLDWEKRFNIILDIARALAYLHLECSPPVIHGDVKPSNVLLDGRFCGYLADFGLARVKAEDQKLDQASERFRSDASDLGIGTPESSKGMKSKSFEAGSEEERKQSKVLAERAMAIHDGDQSLPSSYLGSPHSGMRCSSDMQADSEIPGSTILPLASAFSAPQTLNHHQTDQALTEKALALADQTLNLAPQTEKTVVLADQTLSPTQPAERPNHQVVQSLTVTHQTGITGADQSMPSLPVRRTPQKASGKDWWWKQENSGELKVRDYVMEWMRSELSASENKKGGDSEEQQQQEQIQKQQQAMDMEEGKKEATRKKEKQEQQKKRKVKAIKEEQQEEARRRERAKGRTTGRKSREWWKDEYFAELSRKKGETSTATMNGRRAVGGDGGATSGSVVDRFRLRDVTCSGSAGDRRWRESATETAASDDLSSTTSMRGTVCYVAPEFGGAGALSEASDIYSFGVLLLVIISGRRPIEFTTTAGASATAATSVGSSPTVRRFERANLISWARSLAYSGSVLDLVDDRLQGVYPREQVQLCLALALLCIRRLPSSRPSIAAVLKTLLGEAPPPPLPVEFSPSPPSRLSLHHSPLRAASFVSSSDDMA